MKRALSLLLPLAVLTVAAPAVAQTADDFTRELNGGPPASTLPARPPVTEPIAQPVTQPPATTTAPMSQPAVRPVATQPAPVMTPPPVSASAPVETAAEAPPPPRVVPTVLDAAAITDLPFTLTLPPGFEIVTARPGPDFRVYTVRRGDEPFVMIYAGPSALFPIYDGDPVEAAGRASVLVMEDGRRRALEHLFNRDVAPRQIHVWVASVEAGDRDLAERIAQSVDVP